ncbi:hypothetical protein LTR36_003704 [Oleoguttula mirabilis]|uniref:Zinc transporter n=1 Tax=Oleoguttula mirabilis TaxID=1507867 RepID=A0AAV9JIB6_9PEZI|nr:hypothetical protein LTR36_003704 [Oleoguttula mirabilis]
MASSYALPTTNGGSHQHGHGRSYSSVHLAPDKAAGTATSTFPPNNGGFVKKAVSHGSLYTHAEVSRETSPLQERESFHTPYEQNAYAFQQNTSGRGHLHSHSRSPMKSGRPRGESDLGRPADPRGPAYRPTLERLDSTPAAPASWFSLPEALTALLLPLPYMLASAAYSSISGEELGGGTHALPAYATHQHGASGRGRVLPKQKFSSDSGLIEACSLASGTLLLVGILSRIWGSERVLDRRKGLGSVQQQATALLSLATAQSMFLRAIVLGVPFYAAMQIGGLRTGLVLLATTAAGLTSADAPLSRSLPDLKRILSSRMATAAVVTLCMVMDFTGWTFHAPLSDMCLGYLALALSAFVLPPPLPSSATSSAAGAGFKSTGSSLAATSVLTRSVHDANITLLTGVALSLITIAMSIVWSVSPSLKSTALIFSTLSIAAMSASIFFSQPHTLRSQHKAGLGLGCLLTASCAFLYSPSLWPGTICNGGLSALSFLGVLYDTNASDHGAHEHSHTTAHAHTHHNHDHASDTGYSLFTKSIIARCEPGSLVYGILSEKDSRRIAYFTALNFGFMLVQGVYGYLSGSLGLLSDTVHMFFDCLGLIVGLGAAVASKWPTSPEKPYGWGKLNTLAGFGNGIFLMLVSVEFVWEAIEGMMEGTELRHVKELLVVSTLGLCVNLMGLLAFGHAHAGHDHGHSHSHGHDHAHDHANGHAHSHDGDHTHDHDKAPAHNPAHDHHNDNMHGIFLHVAADAGGSGAVIISTALTLWKPWYLWDPLATIIIAVLIFAAAVPLVTSSGQKLLLVIPDELEYTIKNTLQELGELRGVVGYAVPRFWIDDREASSVGDGHAHHHDHDDDTSGGGRQKVMGVIHIIAAYSADLEDVRERVEEFVRARNMDLVIHVEREADGQCWCGGGPPKSG